MIIVFVAQFIPNNKIVNIHLDYQYNQSGKILYEINVRVQMRIIKCCV